MPENSMLTVLKRRTVASPLPGQPIFPARPLFGGLLLRLRRIAMPPPPLGTKPQRTLTQLHVVWVSMIRDYGKHDNRASPPAPPRRPTVSGPSYAAVPLPARAQSRPQLPRELRRARWPALSGSAPPQPQQDRFGTTTLALQARRTHVPHPRRSLGLIRFSPKIDGSCLHPVLF